jgi:hypothetical protein
MAVRRDYIAGLYRDMLGREGAEHEIAGWEGAPDEGSVYAAFAGSPEYAARTGGQATWHNDASGAIVNNQPQAQPQQYQIQGGGYDDPGFPGGGGITPVDGGGGGGGTRSYLSSDPNVNKIGELYLKYLGRPGSQSELEKWASGAFGWGDANNLAGIERGISLSEEAARHRAANPQAQIEPYTGFNNVGNDYSAFNTARPQDPNKSAKDAFAYISNMAPAPPFNDKKALAQWFNQYVRPGMDALGHKVSSVNEDGFTYSNHEGTFFVDFAQNAGAKPGSMLQRLQWNATPADAATAARYPQGASGGAGSGGRSTGTLPDLRSLFGQLGLQYGGPGGPGVTQGPLEQVGQDPLSLLITGALADFIGRGGSTQFGQEVEAMLRESMNGNNPNVMRRFESARELMSKGQRTMMNDARGALAHRGLLSEPGIPQGAEIGAVKRIEESIAPDFARALRDIYTEETSNALQLATGFGADQARTFLAAIGEGTNRQTALASLALQSLSQNMAWNQFLAEFGLKRDSTLAMLQQGRVDDVMELLNTFMGATGIARGGYV